MRSLKPPCMCMSRRFIVPISSSASTTSGSRISCAMWLSWWRARSSAGTGPCWPPAASISSRRWWARRRMAWSLAFRKRYVHGTRCVSDSFLLQEWNFQTMQHTKTQYKRNTTQALCTSPLYHNHTQWWAVTTVSTLHLHQAKRTTEPWPWTKSQHSALCPLY